MNDADNRRCGGLPAGDGPALEASAEAPCPASPLVLELVIEETEPMSGTVGPAGCEAPIAFHGWIDLMGALSSLGTGSRQSIESAQ